MAQYKVVWFEGEPDLKLKAESGILELREHMLHFQGTTTLEVPLSSIQDVQIQQVRGIGTTVQVKLEGKPLSIVVPRINLGGLFVIVNVVATRRLYETIRTRWTSATPKTDRS